MNIAHNDITGKVLKWAFCILTSLPLGGLGWALTSCSDMLDVDSERQLFDPELDQKTDTIFYALGILQGMQELADQYVFQGEMRGDLVQTTTYTDNNLRQLADFSATATNKYDSAYVYYRVINNCNYYIAHVDTTLRTGADNVMMPEYVAVKAIRAWTYMQLARVYGRVPFYTEPLTQISQIDRGGYPELDMAGIVSALAGDLEQYAGEKLYYTPNYGSVPSGANFNPAYVFMPVDVVLGEMYLETGDYDRAARHYIRYLTRVCNDNNRFTALTEPFTTNRRAIYLSELPSDWDFSNFSSSAGGGLWENIFSSTTDYITYIPMASSKLRGATTELPKTFGYDYYATDKSGDARYIDEVQLVASESFLNLTNAQDYYYLSTLSTSSNPVVNRAKLGDQRYNAITHTRENVETDSTQVWITKFNNARVPLFRTTTVWLHLAEAFNRLGMPDAAFAILKDGIHEYLPYALYMTDETYNALTTTYPLLSSENISKFARDVSSAFFGVHMHGAGMVRDVSGTAYIPGLTAYQMPDIVGKKLQEIADAYQVSVGTTKQDSINAMEDILCDEYALEFAFEGTRFYDLCRLARHKNSAGLYGANYGSLWLARKLAYKNPQKDLTNPDNWYLPFK